jgi:hypothetical protein
MCEIFFSPNLPLSAIPVTILQRSSSPSLPYLIISPYSQNLDWTNPPHLVNINEYPGVSKKKQWEKWVAKYHFLFFRLWKLGCRTLLKISFKIKEKIQQRSYSRLSCEGFSFFQKRIFLNFTEIVIVAPTFWNRLHLLWEKHCASVFLMVFVLCHFRSSAIIIYLHASLLYKDDSIELGVEFIFLNLVEAKKGSTCCGRFINEVYVN